MAGSRRSSSPVVLILGGLAIIAALGLAAFVALVGYMVVVMQPSGGMDAAMAGLSVGKPAPAIEADGWINGEPSSLDGKVVVVHGWFYNCPYCWDEAPHIAQLHEKYGDRVSFVALTTDRLEDRELVEEFVDEGGMKYPVGYGHAAALTLMQGFEASAFPVVWVVGPDGTVVWNRSREGQQSLEEAIQAALEA